MSEPAIGVCFLIVCVAMLVAGCGVERSEPAQQASVTPPDAGVLGNSSGGPGGAGASDLSGENTSSEGGAQERDAGRIDSKTCSQLDAGGRRLLSQMGLYSDIPAQELAQGVIPFEPAHVLWADGADKRRFLKLPPGTQIDTSDMDHWQFPVGTKVFKEFALNGQRLETRMIERAAKRATAQTTLFLRSFGGQTVATQWKPPRALQTFSARRTMCRVRRTAPCATTASRAGCSASLRFSSRSQDRHRRSPRSQALAR